MLVTYNVKLVEGATPDFKSLKHDDRHLVALSRDLTDPGFFKEYGAKVDIEYKADGRGPLVRVLHQGKEVYHV
jgi:hypothetical protein